MRGPGGAINRRRSSTDLASAELVAGDFFAGVPAGGDAYVLKNILRDWDHDQAPAILRRCWEAVPAHGRLLVVEPLLLPVGERSPDAGADLVVRVLFDGGRDRTEPDFGALLAEAGFTLARVERRGGLINLLEATRA